MTNRLHILTFILGCTLLLFLLPCSLSAQKVAVSTNALGYADLLTINARVNVAVGRHISLDLGVKYNPFSWHTGGEQSQQFQDRKRVAALGCRYWPFYVYSGWFISAKAQWQEYNMGGIFSSTTYEGDAYGGGIGFGYDFIITDWFNIELGLGVWGGVTDYSKYALPREGKVLERGRTWFIAPNDLEVSFVFIF